MNRLPLSTCRILLLLYFLAACSPPGAVHPTPVAIPFASHNFPLRFLWEYSTGADGFLTLPLQTNDGVVVSATFDSSNQISIAGQAKPNVYFGLDASTGRLLWKYPTELGYFLGAWKLASGKMLLAGQGRVEALNLITGKIEWTSGGYSVVQSIDTSNDTVFAVSREVARGLDMASGVEKWTNPSLPKMALRLLYDGDTKRVVIVDKVPSPISNIYLLDSESGSVLASFPTNSDYLACDGGSRLGEDFQVLHGRLYCVGTILDLTSGQVVLKSPDFEYASYYLSAPLIESDTWYLTTADGNVRTIDLSSLKTKWEYPGRPNPFVSFGPAVAVANGIVFAIANDATIRALNSATGQEIGWLRVPDSQVSWGGPTDKACTTSITSDGHRIFVAYCGNRIYAFGPP